MEQRGRAEKERKECESNICDERKVYMFKRGISFGANIVFFIGFLIWFAEHLPIKVNVWGESSQQRRERVSPMLSLKMSPSKCSVRLISRHF